MIKCLVQRTSQEIFVFPSEYFIYSTFHALFYRALWGKSTNVLHAPPFKRSSSWVPWTPIASEGAQDTVHFPSSEPSMVHEQSPRSCVSAGGSLPSPAPGRCEGGPAFPSTCCLWECRAHKGFRSVQKGSTDPKVLRERQGTTMKHTAQGATMRLKQLGVHAPLDLRPTKKNT